MKNTPTGYFTPEYFYSRFQQGKPINNRQIFYNLVRSLKIKSTKIANSRYSVYSLKDWNLKVPEKYQVWVTLNE